MNEEITFEPFYGHLTVGAIRSMLQQRFQQDYFQIAHSLAPDSTPFLRHAALSSAIASIREWEHGR